MKLTEVQVGHLYSFTRSHFVEWYDLQTELVDHLANAIEAKWAENPDIAFEEALQSEFKKFGVFGFMDVVEKRQADLSGKYQRLVLSHLKAFFSFPKIVLTITAVALVYLILKSIPYAEETYAVFIGMALAVTIVRLSKSIRNQNRKIKNGEKRWLFKEIINSYGNSTVISIIPLQLLINLSKSDHFLSNNALLFAASAIFVAYYLACYVMLKAIPEKAEHYLRETYPEYRFENL